MFLSYNSCFSGVNRLRCPPFGFSLFLVLRLCIPLLLPERRLLKGCFMHNTNDENSHPIFSLRGVTVVATVISMCMCVHLKACMLVPPPHHLYLKKPLKKYSPETCFAKKPRWSALNSQAAKVEWGWGSSCCQHNGCKVGSSVPGATWRAGVQPWLCRE